MKISQFFPAVNPFISQPKTDFKRFGTNGQYMELTAKKNAAGDFRQRKKREVYSSFFCFQTQPDIPFKNVVFHREVERAVIILYNALNVFQTEAVVFTVTLGCS